MPTPSAHPVFALDHDVLVVLVQLQVDAAVEPATGRAGADVIHAAALAPVVDREQGFQLVPTHAGQRIGSTVANILESVHPAPAD